MVNNYYSLMQYLGAHGLCYLCHGALPADGIVLCGDCAADLPGIGPSCVICASPVLHGQVCADCLRAKQIPFDRSVSLYRYAYPANRLIIDLKFHAQLQLAKFLGLRLAKRIVQLGLDRPEGLVPVPLHTSRMAARGFNQSCEIANTVAGELGIPVFNQACKRVRNTQPQHGLSADLRKQNLQRAFVPNPEHCRGISHVAIVDDVVTTGATVLSLAAALGRAGIGRVDVWSCCRSI